MGSTITIEALYPGHDHNKTTITWGIYGILAIRSAKQNNDFSGLKNGTCELRVGTRQRSGTGASMLIIAKNT